MKRPSLDLDNMEEENYSRQQEQEHDVMELLLQNGQVPIHNQNPQRRSLQNHEAAPPPIPASQQPPPVGGTSTPQLFIHEDEMASWLHYTLYDPSFDRSDLYADCLSQPLVNVAEQPSASYLLPPPSLAADTTATAASVGLNFETFSRIGSSSFPVSEPSTSSKQSQLMQCHVNKTGQKESTVVDSDDTPTAGISICEVSEQMVGSSGEGRGWSFSGGHGGARAITEAETRNQRRGDDRKKKAIKDADVTAERHTTKDFELQSMETNKQLPGSSPTKRFRAAQVHNLSERRRRDRINEKMKVLQELIPGCNKTDKASMLDEAIEYMKSLQFQVQMMSNMGCGMIPLMLSGIQQYIQPHIGMRMPLDMGFRRPMMPFPATLSSSALPTPGVGTHMGLQIPLPTFTMVPPSVASSDRLRIQENSQGNFTGSPLGLPSQPSLNRIPNSTNPYQHNIGTRPTPVQILQNAPSLSPCNSNTTISRGSDNNQSP